LRVGTTPSQSLLALARSVRSFVAQMVRVDGAEAAVDSIRADVERLTTRIQRIAHPGETPRLTPLMDASAGDLRPYYPASASTWHANPVFPPLEVATEGPLVQGTLELGIEYEGPPGCIHGGVVSLIFDQLLGHANIANGTPGMTARLEVSYHAPTPLFTPLEFEARVEQVDGRKITTAGWIAAGGTRTASAVGLFVAPQSQDWMEGGKPVDPG